MSRKLAVPPANRSPKGPGSDRKVVLDEKKREPRDPDPREQGEPGNIAQNTTNQGGRRVPHH
ncbi:MAG: hypothetical protein AB7F22_16035 [Reyranella sp.]|uniref:hypothetical protein n=1 Tax=Reyranella sp. TaxID=1929291 RepID=UPI003D12B986